MNQKFEENPISFIWLRKNYEKISSTQLKVKNNWICPFQYLFILIECLLKTRVKKWKKWKSEKSFETPKFISVFNLPPRQLWSKNCQTANLENFLGLQVIHSESVQIVGDLDNGEWKKSPTERPVSKQSNFCRAIFLQQGCETCLRCARKNSLRYKAHSENEITTTKIRLIPENFSNFEKKLTEFEQKRFGSVVRTETYMSKCLFCEKYFPEAKI